ncbi:phosphoadenylyl-sulfate reductase [Elusimicrobiota bacterium]
MTWIIVNKMDKNSIKQQNLQFLIDVTNNLLNWAYENYKEKVFVTTAFGANGIVMLDFIKKELPVYFIDTGYHFDETLEAKEHYKKKDFNILEVGSEVRGSEQILEEMGTDICCWINKVEPMKRIMKEKEGYLWITAISRSQADTRKNISILELQENNIIKLSPMLYWKEDEVWNYIKDKKLFYNRLYDKGYKSIGCRPCTTPVKDGEDSRAGRWRDCSKEECGLHTDFEKE